MNCTNSKFDDLPAMALCRNHCSFLSDAIRHRYALVKCHVAYLRSPKSIGISLCCFFDSILDPSASEIPSTVLNLPINRKVATEPDKSAVRHSRSHSRSYLYFLSDEDSDLHDDVLDDSPLHLHHHDGDSGIHPPIHTYGQINYGGDETLSSYQNGGYMNMNPNPNPNMNIYYMKNKATPSILHKQRPFSMETVCMEMGEPSSSSFYYPYSNSYLPYANNNPNSSSYYTGSNYDGYGNGLLGSGSGYGVGPAYLPPSAGGMGNLEASSSKSLPLSLCID